MLAVPGALLSLDCQPFLALLEGILRERGEDAEKAIDDLYAAATIAPLAPPANRGDAIQRIMRHGG